ncbi:hypothetical protein ABZ023_27575 [Streptomyces sp. NPDC006367]|uniref:hypothetical protein n=1 Tax=unclassified Streptomyces TaxID=2593676 RepID=UPI0033B165FA
MPARPSPSRRLRIGTAAAATSKEPSLVVFDNPDGAGFKVTASVHGLDTEQPLPQTSPDGLAIVADPTAKSAAPWHPPTSRQPSRTCTPPAAETRAPAWTAPPNPPRPP